MSSFTYMVGIALVWTLFGLPSFVVLTTLIVIFSSNFFLSAVTAIVTLILVWAATSSIAYFISTHSTHPRFVESFVAFLRIAIVVLPPVFYPLSIVHMEELRYLAYVIPTTHASLILQYAMGFPQALENSSVSWAWFCSHYIVYSRVCFVGKGKGSMARRLIPYHMANKLKIT